MLTSVDEPPPVVSDADIIKTLQVLLSLLLLSITTNTTNTTSSPSDFTIDFTNIAPTTLPRPLLLLLRFRSQVFSTVFENWKPRKHANSFLKTCIHTFAYIYWCQQGWVGSVKGGNASVIRASVADLLAALSINPTGAGNIQVSTTSTASVNKLAGSFFACF